MKLIINLNSFQVTITDLKFNKNYSVTLPAVTTTSVSHEFKNMNLGGKYRVVVATDVDDAISSQPVIFHAPAIPPPHQLHIEWAPQNNSCKLIWNDKEMDKNDELSHYVVYYSPDKNNLSESATKVVCQRSPFVLEGVKPNAIYTFAVKAVTKSGYESEFSEIVESLVPLRKFFFF